MSPPHTTSTHGILAPAAARTRFELTRRPPAPDVADLVERHWIVRWDLEPGAAFTQEVLPHPCVNLVTEADRVAVHGMPLNRDRRRLEGSGCAVGTKFRPGAFAVLADDPAGALIGRSVLLPSLFGPAGAALERELTASAGDPDAHVGAVEAFLRRRRPPADRRFEMLREIVADMLVADRAIGVARFARRHAISQRTLQRLFRDYVGVGPKWVLKRYRVHEAAERIAAGETDDAVRLALDLGYFDQSHFIRDFAEQVGCPPGVYARACAAARAAPGPAASAGLRAA